MKRIMVAAIGFFAAALSMHAQESPDLRIRNGTVIDGRGKAAFRADVGIRNGRIVQAGDLRRAPAGETIDASGLIVAPGFINAHKENKEMNAMSVFFAETYTVSFEKMDELNSLLQKATSLISKRPDKFAGLRSYQAFSQMVGEFGGYIEIWEFEDMNDIDAMFKTMFSDKELKKIPQEFFPLVVPGSYKTQVWNSVTEYKT